MKDLVYQSAMTGAREGSGNAFDSTLIVSEDEHMGCVVEYIK